MRALVAYADALTRAPTLVGESHVRRLLDAGLSPAEVIDANQVVAYFNYVNRVADGLGVELEDHWDEQARSAASAALGRDVTPASAPDAASRPDGRPQSR